MDHLRLFKVPSCVFYPEDRKHIPIRIINFDSKMNHPLLEMSEEELYTKMIEAEYNYLLCLESTRLSQITEELSKLAPDPSHWAYNCFFGDRGFKSQDEVKDQSIHPTKSTKRLYKKLSLIVHPDKCKESWAERIFQEITVAYDRNDKSALQEYLNHWETHKSFDSFTKIDKLKVIQRIKNSVWYYWYKKDPMIQGLFLPLEQLNQRLRDQNEALRQKLEETNRQITEYKQKIEGLNRS